MPQPLVLTGKTEALSSLYFAQIEDLLPVGGNRVPGVRPSLKIRDDRYRRRVPWRQGWRKTERFGREFSGYERVLWQPTKYWPKSLDSYAKRQQSKPEALTRACPDL